MNYLNLPAVAIFAFNRPIHLKNTLDAFFQSKEASSLPCYFFSDGPRNPKDVPLVEEVRKVIHHEKRTAQKTIIEQANNLGLANSIISGVSSVLEKHSQIIVLEDDIQVSPHFLPFMLEGLNRYENQERVASICGYMYPISSDGLPQSFFLRGADCWGWATWRRAWKVFEPNGKVLLDKLTRENLTWSFDVDGSYPYTKMLRDQIRGKNNSWAIRWHASTFLGGLVSLFPALSLIQNVGLDGSGTHCDSIEENFLNSNIPSSLIGEWPTDVYPNALACQRIGQFHRNHAPWRLKIFLWFRLIERRLRIFFSSQFINARP